MKELTSKWSYVDSKSSKFYNVELFSKDGGVTWTCQGRYGRIGTSGAVAPKVSGVPYNAAASAYMAECDKRRAKGYDFDTEIFGTQYFTPEELIAQQAKAERIAAAQVAEAADRAKRVAATQKIKPASFVGNLHFL